jgi:hypothetical protein
MATPNPPLAFRPCRSTGNKKPDSKTHKKPKICFGNVECYTAQIKGRGEQEMLLSLIDVNPNLS